MLLNSLTFAGQTNSSKNNGVNIAKDKKLVKEYKALEKDKKVTTNVNNSSENNISNNEKSNIQKLKSSANKGTNENQADAKKTNTIELIAIKPENNDKPKNSGIPDFVFDLEAEKETTSKGSIDAAIEKTQNLIGKYKSNHSTEKNEIITVYNYISNGAIGFSLANFDDSKIKILIGKDSKYYVYNIIPNGKVDFFPLQQGSGNYEISILESKNGKGYKYVEQNSAYAYIEDENNVFLNPIQYNNWTDNEKFTNLIDEITIEAKTDNDILHSIHSYITENVNYDYKKSELVNADYLPNIDLLHTTQEGICYDYSAMVSAALRYKGIPTKVIKGYTTFLDEYHSWNEVLIDNEWITIDTTLDAYYNNFNIPYSIIKNSESYIDQRSY